MTELLPAPIVRPADRPTTLRLVREGEARPRTAGLPPHELRRLVAGAASGDQRCWDRLVRGLSPLVRAVARAHRLSAVDVDDVTQATWCRLVAHIGALRDPERVPAWLATTARRESLRTLGRSQRQIPHGDDLPEPNPSGEGVEAELLRRERDEVLWTAVERLRESDQTLLRMLVSHGPDGDERSYQDIASTLGVAIGSVGPTRGRALQRLRDALEDAETLRPLAA